MVLRFFERAFLILFLLFEMGVITVFLYPEMRAEDYTSVQGSVHTPIAITQALICGTGLILVLMRWRRVTGAFVKVWPLALLITLAPISALWSIDPAITLRRSIIQIAVLTLNVYIAERWGLEEFSRTLAKLFGFTMTISFLLFFVAPVYVLDPETHKSWRGLSENKNGWGLQMGMALVLLFVVRFSRRWEPARYVFVAMAGVSLLLTRSMTSVVTCFAVIALTPLWNLVRLPLKQRIAGWATALVIVSGIAAFAYSKSDAIFRFIGKDATLTGRTDVWRALIIAIQHHPWLGYGFASFWTGLRGESLNVIIASGWLVPEAHNGYLEVLIALGIPGLAIFLLCMVVAFRRGLRYLQVEPRSIAFWPVSFFCFLLLHNLGESDLMNNGTTFVVALFTSIFTSLALDKRTNIRGIRKVLPIASYKDRQAVAVQ